MVTANTTPAGSIPPSCLHDVFRQAEIQELDTGRPVTKLHVGEPWFSPPPEVREAFVRAVRDGRTGYTSAEGLPALRTAIAAKLTADGHATGPDRIVVAPGSCQGLLALLQSLVRPGDEILVPALHWPIHLQQSLLAGFRPVFYPLDERFHPDPASLAELGTERTRAVLVNSPANPTGAVLDRGELAAILRLAHERGWQVISDEAYEHFAFDGEHVTLASLEADLPERERLVSSTYTFSKGYAMTGYRLGYVVSPDRARAAALRVVQEASLVSPQSPVQYAGVAALAVPGAARANAELVRANRDRTLPALVEAGLLREVPAGGWYALLDLSGTGTKAQDFADGLLAARGVSVAPGAGFALRPEQDASGVVVLCEPAPGAETLARVAFCGDPELLTAGVDAIVEYAATHGAS